MSVRLQWRLPGDPGSVSSCLHSALCSLQNVEKAVREPQAEGHHRAADGGGRSGDLPAAAWTQPSRAAGATGAAGGAAVGGHRAHPQRVRSEQSGRERRGRSRWGAQRSVSTFSPIYWRAHGPPPDLLVLILLFIYDRSECICINWFSMITLSPFCI